jgi:hypothetical protein
MTQVQRNDFTWVRGSTDPLVITLGSGNPFDDIRISVYKDGGRVLAFQAELADANVVITDAPSNKVTFTPSAAQTSALSLNDRKGDATNDYIVAIKHSNAWREVIRGKIGASGGGIVVAAPGAAGPAGPAGQDAIGAADVVIFKSGKPSATEIVFYMQVVRAFTWASGLTGSLFKSLAAATSTAVLTIKQNGNSIGTLSFAAAGTVPTVTFASAVTFAVNDVISIEAPGTPDATLANISLCFKGSR